MTWLDLSDLLNALILLPALLGSFALGVFVRGRLPEVHRGPKTQEMLRVVMDMLVTFAAIVLGLLITTAKASFDSTGGDIRTYAIEIITLDQTLRSYGADGLPLRAMLVDYTRDVISETHGTVVPPGPPQDTGIGLGAAATRRFGLLSRIESGLLRLSPAGDLDEHLRNEALEQLGTLQQERHQIGDEAHGQTSASFYIVLGAWLMVVYGCFGLLTEHSWLGSLIVCLSILAIILALFVILDMNTPFTGLVVVSDRPLRDALQTITLP